MKILDVVQGSPEWLAARLGLPTCSQADRILTPARLRPASGAVTYRLQLLAEWVLGYPIEWSGSSAYMERGTELEAEARAAYEVEMGVDVEEVGLVLAPGGAFAGSPDGLVGEDGGLEIKCPALHTHI
ncbi:MAG TPA: YqaJ viral recombinase family protein, partial [Brevibacterium sp.]|nr:YqaJ viral recombinase family protein [Brevibacterium sp.]